MLQILGRPTSINVRKVLWLCDELALPHAHEPQWGTPERPLRTPEFLALNPNALVPVIRDGSRVLWESNTICRYLAAREGRTDLLPADAGARAEVEKWMDWQLGELNSAWRYAFMALVRQSADYTDAKAIEASVANWNRHMTLLDEQLQRTGAYATGATFTLADIVLGLATHRWFSTPMQRPALSAVQRYYDRLAERPAFLKHGRNGIP
jgi:glutathione S-transferase